LPRWPRPDWLCIEQHSNTGREYGNADLRPIHQILSLYVSNSALPMKIMVAGTSQSGKVRDGEIAFLFSAPPLKSH
jgi:hypothetical protein